MSVDVSTILLMIVASSAVICGTLTAMGWGRKEDGLVHWATGLGMFTLLHALMLLSPRLPLVVGVLLVNVLASAMLAMFLAGIYQYQFRTMAWPWLAVPVLLVVLIGSVFLDNYAVRSSLLCLLFIGQIGLMVWTLRTPGYGVTGRGSLLFNAALLILAAVLVSSAVDALLIGDDQPASRLDSSVMQGGALILAFVSVLLATLGYIFMFRDRADRRSSAQQTMDPLTKLVNKQTITAALARDVSRAIRTRQSLAVMMIDVDHFKEVNLQYGRETGDQVLRQVAAVLQNRVRAQDLVGRYRGEEFLLVLPETTLRGAQELARQLSQEVAKAIFQVSHHYIEVTVSIGVYGGWIEQGDDWEMLVDAADRAVRKAKQAGPSRVDTVLGLRRVSAPFVDAAPAAAAGGPDSPQMTLPM